MDRIVVPARKCRSSRQRPRLTRTPLEDHIVPPPAAAIGHMPSATTGYVAPEPATEPEPRPEPEPEPEPEPASAAVVPTVVALVPEVLRSLVNAHAVPGVDAEALRRKTQRLTREYHPSRGVRPVRLHSQGRGDLPSWPLRLPRGAACAWCLYGFDWMPLGEPIRYDAQARRMVLRRRYFCSFACMAALIRDSGRNVPQRLGCMNRLAEQVFGMSRYDIHAAPPRTAISEYRQRLGLDEDAAVARFRAESKERAYEPVAELFAGVYDLVLCGTYPTVEAMEAAIGGNEQRTVASAGRVYGQPHRPLSAIPLTADQTARVQQRQHQEQQTRRGGILRFALPQ